MNSLDVKLREPEQEQRSILIADPDPILRRSICGALGRFQYRILADVESTAEARALVRKLSPDLVVLGQSDTGNDVLDACRAVRTVSDAGVVLLAPIPNLDWIRAARLAGVDILLGRPPREADLVAAVEMSLARRQEMRRIGADLQVLRERVETGSLVQRAKDVLIRRDGLSDSEAYGRLRRQAERTGRPLRQVAEAVVLAATVTST